MNRDRKLHSKKTYSIAELSKIVDELNKVFTPVAKIKPESFAEMTRLAMVLETLKYVPKYEITIGAAPDVRDFKQSYDSSQLKAVGIWANNTSGTLASDQSLLQKAAEAEARSSVMALGAEVDEKSQASVAVEDQLSPRAQQKLRKKEEEEQALLTDIDKSSEEARNKRLPSADKTKLEIDEKKIDVIPECPNGSRYLLDLMPIALKTYKDDLKQTTHLRALSTLGDNLKRFTTSPEKGKTQFQQQIDHILDLYKYQTNEHAKKVVLVQGKEVSLKRIREQFKTFKNPLEPTLDLQLEKYPDLSHFSRILAVMLKSAVAKFGEGLSKEQKNEINRLVGNVKDIYDFDSELPTYRRSR